MTDNLAIALGWAAVVLFFYGPIQWLIIDTVRQEMFAIRDKAFDDARANGLLDTPEHRVLREFINSSIRWIEGANGLVVPKAMLAAWLCRDTFRRNNPLHEMLLREGTPKAFRSAYQDTMRFTIAASVLRSPVLLVVLAATVLLLPVIAVVTLLFGRSGKRIRALGERFERVIESGVAAA
ncbi:hypothetical protein [Thauera sp.]|uniref:hypothetical protein n=1 Tax=Thauera sp. TaxID=1905334 RepID=UPI001B546D7E|nr:hypothetical protein [Thauera sp.]MBP6130888.1 hypothetical protein [Thauera sp.]MBP7046901.1 hypothetical protein [Thauera sp.]